MKKSLISFAVFLLTMHSAHGQFITDINPANTGDPRFIFANPAVPDSGGAPYVVAGYQRLFTNMPLLSNRIIGFVLPTERFGAFALAAPGFGSEHFDKSALELRYAYTFAGLRTTFGFNAGTMLTAYDRSKYRLVHIYDPLLLGNQTLNEFNLGLGATVRPIDNLIIGVSADHLNRPRISFEGSMRRDIHWRAGAMYEWGMLRPMAMLEQEQGETYWSFGGEAWLRTISVLDGVMARAFYNGEFFSIGGGLLYKSLRFDYLYDWALSGLGDVTNGSHQFVMTYNFENEQCDTPPIAFAKAFKDTLHIWQQLDGDHTYLGNAIERQSVNSFAKNGVAYEILNPQANPFLNYVFFGKHSVSPAFSVDRLQELCQFYQRYYADDDAEILLTGHINGSDPCTCDGKCEKEMTLAWDRVGKAEELLNHQKILENEIMLQKRAQHFMKCIEKVPLLKDERQRVDIQIISKDSVLVPWHYSFADKRASDLECQFDLSLSEAKCGWKKWYFAVWRLDGKKKRVVWQIRGQEKAPERLESNFIEWQPRAFSQSQMLYYRLRVDDNVRNEVFSPVDSIYISRSPRPARLLVLFNFDRYAELLGDGALTPEGREGESDHAALINCDDQFNNISDELRLMLESSLKPVSNCKHIEIDSIVGYTDSVGDEEYNENLSFERACLVKWYLQKELGVPVEHVPIRGLGETKPLASNASPAGRWLNRRVEIVIRYKN